MLNPGYRPLTLLGLRPTGDLGPLTAYTTKRGKLVWFLKAPPTCPPSPEQTRQRNTFRLIAQAWQDMTPARREQWTLAEQRAKLTITGYNLFVWWSQTRENAIIHTIERLTQTNLIS